MVMFYIIYWNVECEVSNIEIIHQMNIGFIYDVCQVLICKTAKRESWLNSYVVEGREEVDQELINNTLGRFSDVDSCWDMFTLFYPKKGRLLSELYIIFLKNTVGIWTDTDFTDFLFEPELLRKIVIEWFFGREDLSITDCFNQLADRNDLDENIKVNLYEFLTAPEKYVYKLSCSLKTIIFEMKEYYAKHKARLFQVQKDFDYFELCQKGEIFSSEHIWNKRVEHCTISFSLINRYITLRDEFSIPGHGWILLGIDYKTDIWKEVKPINLVNFGNAIGDPIRMNILKEIHNNGEKTLTELSKKFDLVNAVMLYHLDKLKKERLLLQRHEGRRIYYWLNYSRLNEAILAIKSELGGDLNENMDKTFSNQRKQ